MARAIHLPKIGMTMEDAVLTRWLVPDGAAVSFGDPIFEIDVEKVLMEVESEAGLLARLRPGVDGLVLREGSLTGTFLPAVWSHLPSPENFVRELKRKAGLPLDHWSATLVLQRYTVDEIG